MSVIKDLFSVHFTVILEVLMSQTLALILFHGSLKSLSEIQISPQMSQGEQIIIMFK